MSSIVVGIDGSPEAQAALRWAVDEAALTGADLTAMYVYPPAKRSEPFLGSSHFPDSSTVQQLADESRRWTEQQDRHSHDVALHNLSRFVQEVVTRDVDVHVQLVAMPGKPSRRLVEASRGADLLVVGARGHGGFKDLKLGSVSEQCVRHARCPVLVIRPSER